jgi:8-oxo-dGTP pyrophosphatase MutT (NUDIX family)
MDDELLEISKKTGAAADIRNVCLTRIREGKISRDENPGSHFCVYFAAYDPEERLVFIGRHIKSGLWLFNGGHIDKNESPTQTLVREIKEEWGNSIKIDRIEKPRLLTITTIDNQIQPCKTHFDIWYFLPFNSETFNPNQELLAAEFHETGWKTLKEARRLTKDKNTLEGIDEIEKLSRK